MVCRTTRATLSIRRPARPHSIDGETRHDAHKLLARADAGGLFDRAFLHGLERLVVRIPGDGNLRQHRDARIGRRHTDARSAVHAHQRGDQPRLSRLRDAHPLGPRLRDDCPGPRDVLGVERGRHSVDVQAPGGRHLSRRHAPHRRRREGVARSQHRDRHGRLRLHRHRGDRGRRRLHGALRGERSAQRAADRLRPVRHVHLQGGRGNPAARVVGSRQRCGHGALHP